MAPGKFKGLPASLYVGGSFTSVDDEPASNVARFDGKNWDALGAGVNGPVHAIAPISFSQPGAFVGGEFTMAINPDGSTVSVSNIAFWDRTQKRWLPVGSGLNGVVYVLEVSGYELYAGGAFTQEINGPALNRIARWSFFAQAWQALGSGVDGQFMPEVRALAVGLGGSVSSPRFWRSVFVGGKFTLAGNKDARALAKWKYERPFANRGHTTVVAGSSGRNSSGGGRRSRGVVATSSGYGPCNPGLGKNSSITDDLIFDNPGFRETVELPMLPFLEPFSLKIYDVEDPNTPVATFDSLVVTSENPQALILFGLNDTTAYAPNPDGYSIREGVLLQDLPILANNANEVRAVFAHTVTDAPTVDLVTTNGDTLVSNLNYGSASQPISLPAGSYSVNLLRRGDKQNLGTHTFDVSSTANGYVVILLSGFLNPAANQNGPAATLGVYEISLTSTAVDERDQAAPAVFALSQNYPNPFNPVTSIQYSVASAQFVSLKVYNVLGNEVATLVSEKKPAGLYRVSFDATGLASGVYFVRMNAGSFTQTRRLLLVR